MLKYWRLSVVKTPILSKLPCRFTNRPPNPAGVCVRAHAHVSPAGKASVPC